MIHRVGPALLVIVVANVVMLAGVAANRFGEPDATVAMDERELSVGIVSSRDSVQRVAIVDARWGFPILRWLTPVKLAALGFDVSAPATSASRAFYDHQLPRRVFVVLEFNGPAWQTHVSEIRRRRAVRAQQLEEVRRGERDELAVTERADLTDERQEKAASRLMPVDASTDAAALRRAYPDRHMYIVAPATIRILVAAENNELRLLGTIALVTDSLVLPRQWRGVLDGLREGPRASAWTGLPRYTATVAYGRRLEPWIVSIERIDTPSPPH